MILTYSEKKLTQFPQNKNKRIFPIALNSIEFLISDQRSVSLGYLKLTLLSHESMGDVITAALQGSILHGSFLH
jgi:hypothetical protein